MNRKDITGFEFKILGLLFEFVFVKHIPNVIAVSHRNKTYRFMDLEV